MSSLVLSMFAPNRSQLSSDEIAYIDEKLNCSAQQLSLEPAALITAAAAADKAATNLYTDNYSVFIDSVAALTATETTVQQLHQHIHTQLLTSTASTAATETALLPRLQHSVDYFSNSTLLSLQQQQQTLLMLSQQQQALSDLLELPTLLLQCVNNQLYEEATELLAYIEQLLIIKTRSSNSKHQQHQSNNSSSNSIDHVEFSIVHRIHAEMQLLRQLMINQLFAALSGSNNSSGASSNGNSSSNSMSLSMCLRVVGHLRQLRACDSELSLQLMFLQQRDAWLDTVLNISSNNSNSSSSSSNSNSTYEFVSKYIDQSRIHIFDIITQYKAVFIDDSHNTSSKISTATTAAAISDDSSNNNNDLLSLWTHKRVSVLLSTLQQSLTGINDSNLLLHLLDQCMYCAASLSRVGSDFRCLLPSLFAAVVVNWYECDCERAQQVFAAAVVAYEWHLTRSTLQKIGMPLTTTAAAVATTAAAAAAPINIDALIEYPPLAILLNCIINSVNRMRHCVPIAAQQQLTAATTALLLHACKQIAELRDAVAVEHSSSSSISDDSNNYSRSNSSIGMIDNTSQEEKLAMMAHAADTILLPYVQQLLQALYSSSSSSSSNNVSSDCSSSGQLTVITDTMHRLLFSVYAPFSHLRTTQQQVDDQQQMLEQQLQQQQQEQRELQEQQQQQLLDQQNQRQSEQQQKPLEQQHLQKQEQQQLSELQFQQQNDDLQKKIAFQQQQDQLKLVLQQQQEAAQLQQQPQQSEIAAATTDAATQNEWSFDDPAVGTAVSTSTAATTSATPAAADDEWTF